MVTFRQATQDDIPFLVSLRRATMKEHVERAGREFDELEQRARVLYRFDCAEIITMNGENVGLLKVARDQDPWALIQIQLLPAYQGRGRGRQIIETVLAEAQAADKPVVLDVFITNPARRLYERLGFRIVGQGRASLLMQRDPSRPLPLNP